MVYVDWQAWVSCGVAGSVHKASLGFFKVRVTVDRHGPILGPTVDR